MDSTLPPKKNLVIITSAVHSLTAFSTFSPEMRFLQILRSILTTLEKIPNPYIVLLDTGTMNDLQKEILKDYIHELCIFEKAYNLTKNGGELIMTWKYFNSDGFKNKFNEFATINKLSGRYFFTERFDFHKYDLSKNLIRFRLKDTCPPYFDTRYFRLPVERFQRFLEKYNEFCNEGLEKINESSVENVYYQRRFFEPDECIWDQHIGVGGNFADGGAYVED